jgi:hypothetical protein
MSRISHSEVQLASALKDLQRDWALTADGWSDEARTDFEEKFLRQLISATKTAADAMGEISRLMDRAVRECS